MSLQGDIKTMAVADLLQWAQTAKKTGSAVFQKREIVKELFLENGHLVWMTSNEPREHLGQVALQKNLIDQARLAETLSQQRQSGVNLGKLLLDMQIISYDQLRELLTEKFINSVYDILLWEEGQFVFSSETKPHESADIECNLDLQHLIFEGTRRLDEWHELKRIFHNDAMRFLPKEHCPMILNNPFEAQLLTHVKAGADLGHLLLEMRVHDYYVLSLLKEWRKRNWIDTALPNQEKRPAVVTATATTPDSGEAIDFKQIEALAGKNRPEEALALLNRFADPRLARESAALRQKLELQLIEVLYKDMPRSSTPKQKLTADQLARLNDMDSKTFFILSRINGYFDVGTIVISSPLGEYATLTILKQLLERQLIALLKK